MRVHYNNKIKNILLFAFLCTFLFVSGCINKDALDHFIGEFSNENRTHSIILPVHIKEIDNIKINLNDHTEAGDIQSEACKGMYVENDLTAYQNKLKEMQTSYIDLLKKLKHEEIDQPDLKQVNVLMMLESKQDGNIISFILYDNQTFLINDNNYKTFYRIHEEDSKKMVEIYKQYFDYLIHENTPCWMKEWISFMEEAMNE